ncbi:2940_t:CDS:1, partial [Acaulospora morrowiae]
MENYSQPSITTSNGHAVTRDAESLNTTSTGGVPGENNTLFTPGPRSNAQRPPTLRKPRGRKTSFQGDQVAPEMRPVLHLFEVFSRKLYIEGYLCRQVFSPSPGQQEWTEYFAELCGPMLSLWKLIDNGESEQPEVSPTPIVINILNYSTEFCSPTVESELQRINVFLVSAGQNDKFYLQAPNDYSLNMWICAIRLSCYEGSRLQEVYTAKLIKRPGLKDFLSGTVLLKGKLEGYLQVKFNYADEPKKYWVVVSEHRSEDKKKKSNLAFSRGQALFYETKKSKKPFMTMANVLQTYATYPENPHLIDKTFTFRVEGDLFPAKPTENKPGEFIILTAESLNEMTKWVVGFLDSFKLYGRPKELICDFKNPISPFFAVPIERSNTKLFLDLNEVEHVETRESLADVKAAFAEVLRQSFQYQQQNQDGPQQINPNQSVPQRMSMQNSVSDNSTPRSTNSSNRPYSVMTSTQSSQKGSFSTTSSSITRDSSFSSSPLYGERKSQYNQTRHSNTGQNKKLNRLQNSDDDSDTEESEESGSESENDTSYLRDTKILKDTRKNTKIATEEPMNLPNLNFNKVIDEPIQLGTGLGSLGDNDLMSEIMTAVAERKGIDNVGQVVEIEKKQGKPERTVSSISRLTESKIQDKKKLMPLSSESEDSAEGSPA